MISSSAMSARMARGGDLGIRVCISDRIEQIERVSIVLRLGVSASVISGSC